MKSINQSNEINEPRTESFQEWRIPSHFISKPKFPKRAKFIKADLIKSCLLCDSQIQVKYIPPKKQYSRKNNWGYWTKKATDQHKYLCNTCLWKLHVGKMSDWIECQSRADVFYNYIKKGQFGSKDF